MAVLITSTDALTSDITTGVSTFSVTRSAGEGLIIGFAWVVEWESQPSISSVVWDEAGDNQAFTLVDNVQFNNTERRIAVYHLANPTSAKSSTIKVHWSKSCASSGVGAYVRHVTGHDTSSLLRGSLTTVAQLGGASASISNTIASGVTDLVIDFMGVREGALVYISPQIGQTSAYEQLFYSSNQSISTSSKAGASTVTTGYDSSAPTPFGAALIQLSIKEAAGGGSVATTISATLGNVVGSLASKSSPKTAISATLANVSASIDSGSGSLRTTITATLGNIVGAITSTGNTTNGTFTSEVLKDYAGNVLASVSLNYVRFYNDTTGALVLNKTGVTTNASGIVTFSDAALVAGTTYRVDWETSAGSRRMPRKAAA